MKVDKSKLGELTAYLKEKKILSATEFISKAEMPGEGNMNYTLRVFVDERTFIVKQARPYVEKYPTIAAPENRILVESKFYQLIATDIFLKSRMPVLNFTDKEMHLIVMQDLGAASDFTFLYKNRQVLATESAIACAQFLSTLHANFKKEGHNELMANRELRKLNHEHIFIYPFLEENGLNLDSVTPGLQEFSLRYKQDVRLKELIERLGNTYLSDGDTLLHGDFYPGSWLHTSDGVKIIDPEFSFYGLAEFDVGIMLAHLHLTRQPPAIFELVENNYSKSLTFDNELLDAFTGIEILRRIIGLAQLPLSLALPEKKQLLEKAVSLLKK